MTYKTRQEVLRAAADWMDVCEKAGVSPVCKCAGAIKNFVFCAFDNPPNQYEFPLALLEGKEVWVGSELYNFDGDKFICCESHRCADFANSGCSWNPPKTVMVELDVKDAKKMSRDANERLAGTYASLYDRVGLACKKALESLK